MEEIIIKPIGEIRSPYKTFDDIPIQGKFREDVEAFIELKDEYIPGLRDLDGFSHAFILYYLHMSNKVTIEGKPFLENKTHGIFAIRSPHRPNHIGLSIIRIKKIDGNKLRFSNVDMLDKTPLLDIKPYIGYFDSRDNVKSGWIEKHFENGKIPDNLFLKSGNNGD
jgi:tRNA-Thr(GGU) m(6)t(6)A37 methyltransferase TsaA